MCERFCDIAVNSSYEFIVILLGVLVVFALLVRRASKNFVSWVKYRSVQCEPFLRLRTFIYVFGRSCSICSELGDERW